MNETNSEFQLFKHLRRLYSLKQSKFPTWPLYRRKLEMEESNGFDENNKIKKWTIPTRKLFPYQNPFNCIQFITGAPPHPPPTTPTGSPLQYLSIHPFEPTHPRDVTIKFLQLSHFSCNTTPSTYFLHPVGHFAITSSTLLIRGWTDTQKERPLWPYPFIHQSIQPMSVLDHF